MKKRTKLKNLNMTSVDLVKRGANQEAEIRLYKSADEQPEDMPEGLVKSVQKAVREWWEGSQKDELEIAKAEYMDALDFSLGSIIGDAELDDITKAQMATESVAQFAEAMAESITKSLGVVPNISEEGDREMMIDKSRFTAEELEQYNTLIAKGLVEKADPEDYVDEELEDEAEDIAEEEIEGEIMDKGCGGKMKKTEKSLHPEVAKALQEVEEMKKSFEMKEMHEVAKKYSVLGKKEDELAQTMYDMKKASPEAYDNFVTLLDEQVEMVNKSGLFQEIGKSGRGPAATDAEGKINGIATEIQKADPSLSRQEAIMKAWDQNPELLAEYESTYKGGMR